MTPLFEIGATLGAALAPLLHVSVPFLAGLGFIGVFSGATNTPIACFVMGIELFGSGGSILLYDLLDQLYVFRQQRYLFCSASSGQKGILFLPIVKRMKEKRCDICFVTPCF